MTEQSESIEVVPIACAELYKANGYQPSAPIYPCCQIVNRYAVLAGWHKAYLNATALKIGPRVYIRGKLSLGADKVVARLPIEAGSHDIEAVGHASGEADFISMRAHKAGYRLTDVLDLVVLPQERLAAPTCALVQVELHCLDGGAWGCAHRGVVQVGIVFCYWEQRANTGHVHVDLLVSAL